MTKIKEVGFASFFGKTELSGRRAESGELHRKANRFWILNRRRKMQKHNAMLIHLIHGPL